MTPNRADATCLMRASRRRPSRSGAYHAGSSPPSPVLAAPPARWIPIVNAWCASGDSAPTLIAETTNRRAIDRALSTSVNGTAVAARRTRRPSRGTAGASSGRASADAIPGERPVDADGLVERRRDAGQRLHLAGDPRREQVRLAVAAVPGQPRVGQSGLAAGAGSAIAIARPGVGAGARRDRRVSPRRATPRRSGSNAPARPGRGRPCRSARRRRSSRSR